VSQQVGRVIVCGYSIGAWQGSLLVRSVSRCVEYHPKVGCGLLGIGFGPLSCAAGLLSGAALHEDDVHCVIQGMAMCLSRSGCVPAGAGQSSSCKGLHTLAFDDGCLKFSQVSA
jgi:hypothetical protein